MCMWFFIIFLWKNGDGIHVVFETERQMKKNDKKEEMKESGLNAQDESETGRSKTLL